MSQVLKGGYPSFTNLLFAVPESGRPVPMDILFAFHSMAMPMNYNNITQRIKGQPVSDAREFFAQQALSLNCKYIFFWDEDVECPPQTIPELIYKMEQYPDIAVCGGVYCLKRDPSEPLIFMGNGNGPYWDWKVGEFFECSGIGMGCTVVRVDCLRDLKRPWFKTVYDYSKMLDGVKALESWTEDLYFCKRVTDSKKWKVYCDSSILCKHHDLNTGKVYTLPSDSKPFQRLNTNIKQKKVLDIGSGIRPEGHYKTVNGDKVITCEIDTYSGGENPDYRCDLSKLPFGSCEFDIIFSAILEIFPNFNTISVLKEWKRVLKPKGELHIVVDNVKVLMSEMINDKLPMDSLHYFAGKYPRHNTFTEYTLRQNLIQAGFEENNISTVPSDEYHIGIRVSK